jgi:hypothetical protein
MRRRKPKPRNSPHDVPVMKEGKAAMPFWPQVARRALGFLRTRLGLPSWVGLRRARQWDPRCPIGLSHLPTFCRPNCRHHTGNKGKLEGSRPWLIRRMRYVAGTQVKGSEGIQPTLNPLTQVRILAGQPGDAIVLNGLDWLGSQPLHVGGLSATFLSRLQCPSPNGVHQ